VRLIQQVVLQFIGGNSRKAYEVDLCDVGDGKFVVNFRYGRIGTNLRDGTKTAAPVDEARARQLFDKLVDEKKAKGYVEVPTEGKAEAGAPTPEAPAPAREPSPPAPASDLDGRRRAVLEQLAAADGKGRRIGRLARSAAELGLVDAVPLLLRHLEAPTPKNRERPKLRLVGGGKKPPARPTNVGTVVAWSATDMVGRLRTETGEELKFGGSACKGFFPAEGQELIYRDVDDHPLGGRRALTLTLLPEDQQKLEEARAAARPRKKAGEDKATRRQVLERHGVVWALARLASASSFERLAAIYFEDGEGELSPLARIAVQGALRAANDEQRTHIVEHLRARMPAEVRDVLESGDDEKLTKALRRTLAANDNGAHHRVIDLLYLAGGEAGRAAVLRWLDDVRLQPPAFQRVRHLFKAAELGEDWELFGRIAHKIETHRAMYGSPSYGDGVYLPGWQYVRIAEEMAFEDPRLAFSSATRWYFRRRVWRTLRRLGVRGLDAYVRAAVGVLAPFSDADAKSVKTSSRVTYPGGDWQNPVHVVTEYDRFAGFKALNHILYTHSPRYELAAGRVTWSCREGHEPGDPAPAEREEAFPALWDAQPIGLLHLLTSSTCSPVLEFAARAARANRPFFDSIDDEPVAALLARPHRLPAELGWELAQARLGKGAPSVSLVVGLLLATLDEARAAGRDALQDVAASDHQELVARVVATLTALGPSDPTAPGLAIVDALLAHVPSALAQLGPDVLRDLMTSPSAPAQLLAVAAMRARGDQLGALPGELLTLPIGSEHAEVRRRGVTLLEGLGSDALAERLALLRDLLRSPHAEVREAAGPLVAKVAADRPDLGADLATLLCSTLLYKEQAEGVHRDVLALLKGDLKPSLDHLPAVTVWRLVDSRQQAAQDLGGTLLRTHVTAADVDLWRMSKLLSHDVLSVREAGRDFAEQSIDRLKAELGDAVRFLDAKWEDSRQWAMTIFREQLLPDGIDVAPVGVLIAICDSPREDVQAFGRDLVQRHFQDTMGTELLAKLSEHPSGSLQLYVTSLLERFCDGPERLEQLAPYFFTVLSRVNRGGVTKQRVYRFLDEQAQQSEHAARTVATILNRQSATMAVGDKARAIETLVTISERYPAIELVIAPVVDARLTTGSQAGEAG
jgi:predicted DNA-binding WGR domain protein